MPFVHSLVRSPNAKKRGWCAPLELGEAAPHYVSFVVPVNEEKQFFATYSCEVVKVRDRDKLITPYEMALKGRDAFLLSIGERQYWFIVRPTWKSTVHLPYIGKLKHPDFQFLFTEIEPEDPDKLDNLFSTDQTFIMGCDPYSHYEGIKEREIDAGE